MKPVRQRRVRALLRMRAEGMSATEISLALGMHIANVRTALRAMPDVYVDRWQPGKRGQYEKVWCAAHVPAHCPHPKDKIYRGGVGKPKTVWQPLRVVK